MRTQPTGEPDAGDPHVRFGGEGASAPLPNPTTLDRFRPAGTLAACALSLRGILAGLVCSPAVLAGLAGLARRPALPLVHVACPQPRLSA